MNKKNRTSILYFVAAILFFIASIIGKNYTYITLGCCFIIFGISNSKGEKDKKK